MAWLPLKNSHQKFPPKQIVGHLTIRPENKLCSTLSVSRHLVYCLRFENLVPIWPLTFHKRACSPIFILLVKSVVKKFKVTIYWAFVRSRLKPKIKIFGPVVLLQWYNFLLFSTWCQWQDHSHDGEVPPIPSLVSSQTSLTPALSPNRAARHDNVWRLMRGFSGPREELGTRLNWPELSSGTVNIISL